MGLGTTHNCFRGGYSQFSHWRLSIGRAAGYATRKGDPPHEWLTLVEIPEELYTEDHLVGIWGNTPDDALLVLFAHADDEGRIYPEQAAPLADRLEALLSKLQEPWRAMTVRFVAGLRLAVALSQPVEFN